MSKKDELSKKIELIRQKMHEAHMKDGELSPRVMRLSRQLDRLLNKYGSLDMGLDHFDKNNVETCRNSGSLICRASKECNELLYSKGMRLLGKNVKRILKKKDMTQKQLAGRIGISRSYMSKICRGEGNPCLSKLIEIAYVLEVEIGDLFREK